MSRSAVLRELWSSFTCRLAVILVNLPAWCLSCVRELSSVSLRDSRQPFNTLRRKSSWCPMTCKQASILRYHMAHVARSPHTSPDHQLLTTCDSHRRMQSTAIQSSQLSLACICCQTLFCLRIAVTPPSKKRQQSTFQLILQ